MFSFAFIKLKHISNAQYWHKWDVWTKFNKFTIYRHHIVCLQILTEYGFQPKMCPLSVMFPQNS